MPLALIPVVLLIVPIVEIAAFILVGDLIGLWPTLGLVVTSAVLGAVLLRRQGLSALRRIQAEVAGGRMPGRDLVHGMMILAAGILLLTPGLVTDVVGYLLFIPAVRDGLWRFFGRRFAAAGGAARPGGQRPQGGGGGGAGKGKRPMPDVVDLEAEDYERRSAPSSPWRGRHDGNRTLH